MLHKVFTYTDYDGKEATLDAYFQLSKNDCIDLDRAFEKQGGLINYLTTLLLEIENRRGGQEESLTNEEFVRFVRVVTSKAYGERPKNNPSLFLKEDDYGFPLAPKFRGTPAYDDFVFGLLTGKEDFAAFSEAILPNISPEQRAEGEKLLAERGLNLRVLEGGAAETETASEAPINPARKEA